MKKLLVLFLVLGLIFSVASGNGSDDTIKLKTLGRAPLTPEVKNIEMARQTIKDYAQEIENLEEGIIFDLSRQIGKAEFKEESIAVGSKIRWMLFKDKNGVVRHITNVEWAGQEPISAFSFEILSNNLVYRFAIPKICGNICLLEIKKFVPPPPPAPPAKPVEPEPQTPKKSIEQQKPTETKFIPPAILALPQTKKQFQPNFKIKVGPWIPWEPMILTAEISEVNLLRQFNDYLPKYEKFLICESGETGIIYLNTKGFPYKTGDSVWLKKQRSFSQTSWSGINFNLGAEMRMWKNFWLGVDYYQSRKLKVSVFETVENMYFKNVEYIGYYTAPPESSLLNCPPQYHIYSLKLNRHSFNLQSDYTFLFREINLVLRYYLNLGPSSISLAVGGTAHQFEQKVKEHLIFDVLYPWKDQVIDEEEDFQSSGKTSGFQIGWMAGAAAELKLDKHLAVNVEGAYRKLPQQNIQHQTIIPEVLDPMLNFKFEPWRITGTIKFLF